MAVAVRKNEKNSAAKH